MTLFFYVTALARAMAESLVLQRALAALVAHWAIQRMIGKQQFEDAFLRFFDAFGCCANHLAFGNRCHARDNHHRAAWAFYFNQALATHANWCHAWVIAKTRNEFVCVVGCGDDEVALFSSNGFAVNREADCCWVWRRHDAAPTAVTGMVMRLVTRDSNSLLNSVRAECNGANAEGPTKQMVVIL